LCTYNNINIYIIIKFYTNYKYKISNHSNEYITRICLATQCRNKRKCCLKCQTELYEQHNIDLLVDINYLFDFIKT